MQSSEKTYIAIDLKSFYASVECMLLGLDPMTTNLVVADASRTEKTICLAVSPSLKAYGIPGRARLFEVVQKVREANSRRLSEAVKKRLIKRNEEGQYAFTGTSSNANELNADPTLELSYIIAQPRMKTYMEYSTKIYNIYLRYISPEDIHVYSIDEVIIDVTEYLPLYHLTAHELAMKIIRDILSSTGITATCGIGTNMYLAKVAMDIVGKHVPADKDGVRIAELDEYSYRKQLWTHTPLTDFWRVGPGTAKKLQAHGMYTMGDVARCSISDTPYWNEDLLYKLFGINAELLIDHAWGWEPTTIALVKAYKPETNSICSGQVLPCPYDYEKMKIIVREMADLMALDLVEKGLVTDQLTLTIGYDRESLEGDHYKGPVTEDRYGRKVPKHAHGTIHLGRQTSSTRILMEKTSELFERIINKDLLVRRLYLNADKVVTEASVLEKPQYEQMDLFTDYAALKAQREAEEEQLRQEKKLQKAMLDIKKKYGKNAILKGMNLQEGATTTTRNKSVGGHKA